MGCCSSIAAMTGANIRSVVMAAEANPEQETLVVIYLRGGLDGLNLVPPIDGPDRGHYEGFRPEIAVPNTGDNKALRLDAQFGLHPSAAPLYELFQDGKLAIVHAVGSAGSRSHFEAQNFMELGTPNSKTIGSGWLARHLQTAPTLPDTILMPSLAAMDSPPTSLAGSVDTLTMASPSSFSLSSIGNSTWRYSEQRVALRQLYNAGTTSIHEAGLQAMNAADLIESYVSSDYDPSNGAEYPNSSLGRQLRMIAQMIKLEVGLQVATVDYGGWDTHNQQGDGSGGYFAGRIGELSNALAALYQDLNGSGSNPYSKRLTVVVKTEFGRRVRENGDRGTDHGTAFPMFVLGGNVIGGLHGEWPGLAHEQLYDNADLRPTTDFRRGLSEVLIRRLGNPNLGQIFPGYTDYSPIGIVTGQDIEPIYTQQAPVAPATVSATVVSVDKILVEWANSPGAEEYKLERRAGESGTWESLGTVGSSVRQYEDQDIVVGTEYHYRVQAINAGGVSEYTDVAPAVTRTAIELWRLQHFGTALNAGIASDSHVYADDGMSNLTKYALALNPKTPARAVTTGFTPGRPRVEISGGQLVLTFVRPADRDGINYAVRMSSDMRSWSPVTDEADGAQGAMVRRRASIPVSSDRQYFLDLQISRTE